MIALSSVIFSLVSMMAEETNEEAEARILAEAQAYVAGLSDDEFEAWVVSMEKMGRFVEIAKIMRVKWTIGRLESLLLSALYELKEKETGTLIRCKVVPFSSYIDKVFGRESLLDICNVFSDESGGYYFDDEGRAALSYFSTIHLDEKVPHNDTRRMCCLDPKFAYLYACIIDKTPRNDTRKSACKDPHYAFKYAVVVDKKPCVMTRNAVIGSEFSNDYDNALWYNFKTWYKRFAPGVYESIIS